VSRINLFKESCSLPALRAAWLRVEEAELDDARATQLLERLRGIVAAEDDLRVYRLCKSCLDASVVVRGGSFQVDPDFYQV
jgi:hypothetical protein